MLLLSNAIKKYIARLNGVDQSFSVSRRSPSGALWGAGCSFVRLGDDTADVVFSGADMRLELLSNTDSNPNSLRFVYLNALDQIVSIGFYSLEVEASLQKKTVEFYLSSSEVTVIVGGSSETLGLPSPIKTIDILEWGKNVSSIGAANNFHGEITNVWVDDPYLIQGGRHLASNGVDTSVTIAPEELGGDYDIEGCLRYAPGTTEIIGREEDDTLAFYADATGLWFVDSVLGLFGAAVDWVVGDNYTFLVLRRNYTVSLYVNGNLLAEATAGNYSNRRRTFTSIHNRNGIRTAAGGIVSGLKLVDRSIVKAAEEIETRTLKPNGSNQGSSSVVGNHTINLVDDPDRAGVWQNGVNVEADSPGYLRFSAHVDQVVGGIRLAGYHESAAVPEGFTGNIEFAPSMQVSAITVVAQVNGASATLTNVMLEKVTEHGTYCWPLSDGDLDIEGQIASNIGNMVGYSGILNNILESNVVDVPNNSCRWPLLNKDYSDSLNPGNAMIPNSITDADWLEV